MATVEGAPVSADGVAERARSLAASMGCGRDGPFEKAILSALRHERELALREAAEQRLTGASGGMRMTADETAAHLKYLAKLQGSAEWAFRRGAEWVLEWLRDDGLEGVAGVIGVDVAKLTKEQVGDLLREVPR